MLAEAHRQAAEDIEMTILPLQATSYAARVVILYGSVARHEERPLDMPDPSDVDLLAILDSDDPHVDLHQGDALSHSLGLAYNRHLDAPREVQVQFASRTLQEWDPTFIANVARDGIILFKRGPLPIPFAA